MSAQLAASRVWASEKVKNGFRWFPLSARMFVPSASSSLVFAGWKLFPLIDITPLLRSRDRAAEDSGELLEEGRIVFVPDDTATLYAIPGFKCGGVRRLPDRSIDSQ